MRNRCTPSTSNTIRQENRNVAIWQKYFNKLVNADNQGEMTYQTAQSQVYESAMQETINTKNGFKRKKAPGFETPPEVLLKNIGHSYLKKYTK